MTLTVMICRWAFDAVDDVEHALDGDALARSATRRWSNAKVVRFSLVRAFRGRDMKQDDLSLLQAYADKGEEAAFEELFRRHGAWVFSAARRRLGDDHLADDATQVVFIILSSKAAQLAAMETPSIRAWLFHVMHLTCGRFRRTMSRRSRHELNAGKRRQDGIESAGLVSSALLMLLEDSIAQLPAMERDAVIRRFYEGASFDSIAAPMGISAEAVRKRIGRALAQVRLSMLRDDIDVIPATLLPTVHTSTETRPGRSRLGVRGKRIHSLAKGTMTMMSQMEAIDFAVVSAEYWVRDVEANLDFFEKLGFRRHYMEAPDAMGRMPRASLRGGATARIWLRRSSDAEGTRPRPGVGLFFWIKGGLAALATHRESVAAQGVEVGEYIEDISLRSFTVTSPDGYSVGFFTSRQ